MDNASHPSPGGYRVAAEVALFHARSGHTFADRQAAKCFHHSAEHEYREAASLYRFAADMLERATGDASPDGEVGAAHDAARLCDREAEQHELLGRASLKTGA